MRTPLLQSDDLDGITNAESLSALFGKIGYQTRYSVLTFEDLALSPRNIAAVKQVYLIAHQGNFELQVWLFELKPEEWTSDQVAVKRMQAIAKNLCIDHDAYFLLLATLSYQRLLLMSPLIKSNQSFELVTQTRHSFVNLKDASFTDRHTFESIAVQGLDVRKLHQTQQSTLFHAQFIRDKKQKRQQTDPIREYLKAIGRYQLLTAEQEILLAHKIERFNQFQEDYQLLKDYLGRSPTEQELAEILNISVTEYRNCKQAKNKLIEHNLRLVVSIAKKYQRRGLELLDLIQEGNLGLIKAAEKFDYKKGNKFSTHAYWWIRQSITRAICDQSRIIRLPVHLYEKISQLKKKTKILIQDLGRKPTYKELAASMGTNEEAIRNIQQYCQPIISWDINIKNESDKKFEEIISLSEYEDPLDQIERLEVIEQALLLLSENAAKVIQLRYGLIDGKCWTLQAIGDYKGVSRERIRQIEGQALKKLRRHFKNYHTLPIKVSLDSNQSQSTQNSSEKVNTLSNSLANNSEYLDESANNLDIQLSDSQQPQILNHNTLLKGKTVTDFERKREIVVNLLTKNFLISDEYIAALLIFPLDEIKKVRKELETAGIILKTCKLSNVNPENPENSLSNQLDNHTSQEIPIETSLFPKATVIQLSLFD